jgi:hypothetical protein
MPEIESNKYNDAKSRKDKAKCETMKGQKQSSKEDSRHGPPSRTLNQQWVVTKRNGRNKDFLLGQYIQRYFFVFIPYTENTCVNPLIPSTMTQ